jgi:hypothetical protein
VDTHSPRAEELRRLLDVVAGLAPDELGRISEPIVKDELAIVEFLTQRANNPISNDNALNDSTPILLYHIPPTDTRPSVLEEHVAPMLSKPSNARTGHHQPTDDPAWSFVAPEMATLDIHAPFSPAEAVHKTESVMSSSSVPGPLRPPPPRGLAAQLATIYADRDSTGRDNASEDAQVRRSSVLQNDQSLYAGSPLALDRLNQPIADQFATGDQMLSSDFGLDQTSAANIGTWWNDIGTNLSVSQNSAGSFNPFALAQFGQIEEGDSK